MPSNEDILKALSLDPNQAQPQSRSDLLYGLVPDYLKYQEPSPMPPSGTTPGKIGPPSGMPTALDVAGKALPDALSWLAPAAGKVAGAAGKAIVPFSVASKLASPNKFLPAVDSSFEQAVANSGGELTSHGLMLDLLRYQSPRRAGKDALSGGVFYMTPKSDPRMSEIYNANTNKKMPWGGTQEISGKTLFKNPYIAKAGWGGPAVFDVAAPDLLGQTESWFAEKEANEAARSSAPDKVREDFLKQWAPEVTPPPPGATKDFRRLVPWLMEAAVGSKARQLGYDSIIAHGIRSAEDMAPQTKPTVNEIFDLRESHYPTPEGGYKMWPQFQQHLLEALKR